MVIIYINSHFQGVGLVGVKMFIFQKVLLNPNLMFIFEKRLIMFIR